MLKKLLKYDLKSGFGIMGLLYAGLVLLYGLGQLFRLLKVTQMMVTIVLAMVLAGVAMIVIAMVVVVTRFHKGLFGAEGYLTQTLPVGKGYLIASKAITAYLLLLASILGFLLAIVGVLHLTDAAMLKEMLDTLLGGMFLPLVIYGGIAALIQLGMNISTVYAAITLANTRPFIRNNIAYSVVFYFVGNMAASMLELVGMLFIPFGLRLNESGGVSFVFDTTFRSILELGTGTVEDAAVLSGMNFGLGSMLVDAGITIGLLFLCKWMMTHKTSVK